ncbi:MAG: bifunctional 4-hydroxy-2-oxoglutarate aldolase/2-dehydro-3-deoxy-phosphogluconate aldolase [Rhodoglobus sp.]
MFRFDVAQRIAAHGIVAIVRANSAEAATAAASALIDAGQTVVEVSMTTPGTLDVINDLNLRFGDDVLIGAGTVLDETTARLVSLAGARFVVAPSVNPGVLSTAHRYGMATLPGAIGPTEIVAAVSAGADFVKLFPASAYGPKSVKDMLAALPQVALVPTGGVTLDNAADYIRAGAVAVGMGSALTTGTTAEMSSRVAALVKSIAHAKSELGH